jgi:hypothetical protein
MKVILSYQTAKLHYFKDREVHNMEDLLRNNIMRNYESYIILSNCQVILF